MVIRTSTIQERIVVVNLGADLLVSDFYRLGQGWGYEVLATQAFGLQVVRRTDGTDHRKGADRRGRSQWLRQVEPAGSAALGDGRKLLQEHARLRHGRCHLLRYVAKAGPQHGGS